MTVGVSADCTAANDCGACIQQEGGLFGAVDCSYCTSSGECTTDMTSSCSGDWIGDSSTCVSCSPTCPSPGPPPTPGPSFQCPGGSTAAPDGDVCVCNLDDDCPLEYGGGGSVSDGEVVALGALFQYLDDTFSTECVDDAIDALNDFIGAYRDWKGGAGFTKVRACSSTCSGTQILCLLPV